MSGEGFIASITRILLEDAGLSVDPVPANSAGAGRVDGIGIGPRGEPGGAAHRKRKRDALKSRMDRKLHTALTAEDHVVELDLLSDAGQWRFDEGNKDGAIDAKPMIDTDKPDTDPNPRRKTKMPSKRSLRRGPDAEIHLNPVLPTRFEDRIAEDRAGGTVRIDYLIRIGLGDVKKINYCLCPFDIFRPLFLYGLYSPSATKRSVLFTRERLL